MFNNVISKMVLMCYSTFWSFLSYAFFCSEVEALLWEILFSSNVEKLPVWAVNRSKSKLFLVKTSKRQKPEALLEEEAG